MYSGNPTPTGNKRNLVTPKLTSFYPMKALFTFQKNLLIIILNINNRYSLVKRILFVQQGFPAGNSHKFVKILVNFWINMKFRLKRSYYCGYTHVYILAWKLYKLEIYICLHILILFLLYFMNKANYFMLFTQLFELLLIAIHYSSILDHRLF